MTSRDDTVFVRRLFAPYDPLPNGPSQTEVANVRDRVRPPRRAGTVLRVAAAVVALLLVVSGVPFLRPPAAWAVEPAGELGVAIRVELPEFYQRGPDPDQVVAALRGHGVPVAVHYNRDLTPWKIGRIVGLSASYGDLPRHLLDELEEAMAPGGRETVDVDLTEIGIDHHPDGEYTIFPDRFEDHVEIVVAVPLASRAGSGELHLTVEGWATHRR